MERIHAMGLASGFAFLIAASPFQSIADDAYGQWAGKPHDEWPRIAMVNQIEYSDASHPVAGCGFLLDTGDEILAATAKHVLLYFKSEVMDSVSFQGTLRSWRMFPKDAPREITTLGELINENSEESLKGIPTHRDWLLFTVKERSRGVQALRVRSTPLKPDEPVFIVGWRYTDEGAQKIYRGKYARSEEGSVLISVKELEDNTMPGLSGAPVIDARGYVIGLMSAKAGSRERLASVDYPQALVSQRVPGNALPPDAATRAASCPEDADECARNMAAYFRTRGWVGITPETDPDSGVVSVIEVFPDSPAEKAGFLEGDIVRGVNGIDYAGGNGEAIRRAYDSFRPGGTVIFDVEREGRRHEIKLVPEPIPESTLTQWIDRHLLEQH